METKVEALEGNRVKVTVTIEAKEVNDRIKRTYREFAQRSNFPGFRKGKAPRAVIDNYFGKDGVRSAVTEDLTNDSYPLAVDASGIYPVGNPQIDDLELVVEGEDYVFAFTVETKPEYELSSYDAVEIELPAEGATEAEVDEQIDYIRESYGTLENAPGNTKVKADSTIQICLKATDDAGEDMPEITNEDRTYALGSGLFPAAFDEQLVGLKKNGNVQFSIDSSDEGILMARVADKTSRIDFDVTVLAVKKRVLPEVTDEWASETLGFESAEDLRNQITEQIASQKAAMMPSWKENRCLEVLASRLQGEVPAALSEQTEAQLLQDFFGQLQAQGLSFDVYLASQGITSEQFRDDVKKQAADIVAQDLALDAYARQAGLEASEEDIIAEFGKSGAPDPEALRAEWTKAGRIHLVREAVLRYKAVQEIMDAAVVSEEKPKAAKKKASKKAEKAAEADAE